MALQLAYYRDAQTFALTYGPCMGPRGVRGCKGEGSLPVCVPDCGVDDGRPLPSESSMTRLFLHGRTETVRPATMESVAFVKAMIDPNAAVRVSRGTRCMVLGAHPVSTHTRTRSACACCTWPPTSIRTATARP